jgi:hypothetical protein
MTGVAHLLLIQIALHAILHTVRKETSGELLTKEAMETNRIIYKYTHILKLLFSVVTAGIETLAVWGNKFLNACVKEVCRL